MNAQPMSKQIAKLFLLVVLLVSCNTGQSPVQPTPVAQMATATRVVETLVPTSTITVQTKTPIPTMTVTRRPDLTPTFAPTATPRADGLSEQEAATLDSLTKVDDYPLYTMSYYGSYDQRRSSLDGVNWSANALPESPRPLACSLFAALGDAGNMLYGRNLDWEYSPALLLFTEPPNAYASVSMVDIAYLGFKGDKANMVTDLPLGERRTLLNAQLNPFDGMNERGLVIAMAAVPDGQMKPDPKKETIDNILVIRKVLDYASKVDEAVAILQRYNISMTYGPPTHYLIADSSGRAVLVEFHQGKMNIIPNEKPWHLATNFLRSAFGENLAGQCSRYDTIFRRLTQTEGRANVSSAINLLMNVAQKGTQWSIVYGMSTGEINIAMGNKYNNVHTFHLKLAGK